MWKRGTEGWEIQRQHLSLEKYFQGWLTAMSWTVGRLPQWEKCTCPSRPSSGSQHESGTLNLLPVQGIISFTHRFGSCHCISSVIVPFTVYGNGSLSAISHLLSVQQAAELLLFILFRQPHVLGFLIRII